MDRATGPWEARAAVPDDGWCFDQHLIQWWNCERVLVTSLPRYEGRDSVTSVVPWQGSDCHEMTSARTVQQKLARFR